MVKRLFACPECDNALSRTQAVLGWCYLPVHFAVLPLLLSVLAVYFPGKMDGTDVNMLYYCTGVVFVLAALGTWLRKSFDVFLDSPGRCVLCMAIAFAANYAMSMLVQIVLLLLELGADNPNNAELSELADMDYGAMKAVSVFMAPIVEEALFRGVVFGTIRRKSRAAAYAVSMALFGLYHVWRYAQVYADPWQLIYMLQYLPVAFVLAWQYERSGSIWTPIAFHMLFNALAFFVLTQL